MEILTISKAHQVEPIRCSTHRGVGYIQSMEVKLVQHSLTRPRSPQEGGTLRPLTGEFHRHNGPMTSILEHREHTVQEVRGSRQ